MWSSKKDARQCHPIPQPEHMNKMWQRVLIFWQLPAATFRLYSAAPTVEINLLDILALKMGPWHLPETSEHQSPTNAVKHHRTENSNAPLQKNKCSHKYKVVPVHAIRAQEGVQEELQWFLASTLDRDPGRFTFTQGKEAPLPPPPRHPLTRRLRGPQSHSGLAEKISCPCREWNHDSPGHPARSSITTPTTLSAPH
jgi:hypothetical protein